MLINDKKYRFSIVDTVKDNTKDRVELSQSKIYYKSIKLFGTKIPIRRTGERSRNIIIQRSTTNKDKGWFVLKQNKHSKYTKGPKVKNKQLLKFLNKHFN